MHRKTPRKFSPPAHFSGERRDPQTRLLPVCSRRYYHFSVTEPALLLMILRPSAQISLSLSPMILRLSARLSLSPMILRPSARLSLSLMILCPSARLSLSLMILRQSACPDLFPFLSGCHLPAYHPRHKSLHVQDIFRDKTALPPYAYSILPALHTGMYRKYIQYPRQSRGQTQLCSFCCRARLHYTHNPQ